MFTLDFPGEPDLAVAQFVKSRLDLLFHFLEIRKVDKRIGLLRALIGHNHLANARSQNWRRTLLHSYRPRCYRGFAWWACERNLKLPTPLLLRYSCSRKFVEG